MYLVLTAFLVGCAKKQALIRFFFLRFSKNVNLTQVFHRSDQLHVKTFRTRNSTSANLKCKSFSFTMSIYSDLCFALISFQKTAACCSAGELRQHNIKLFIIFKRKKKKVLFLCRWCYCGYYRDFCRNCYFSSCWFICWHCCIVNGFSRN